MSDLVRLNLWIFFFGSLCSPVTVVVVLGSRYGRYGYIQLAASGSHGSLNSPA